MIITNVSTRGTARDKQLAKAVYSRSAILNLVNEKIKQGCSAKEDPYYKLIRG